MSLVRIVEIDNVFVVSQRNMTLGRRKTCLTTVKMQEAKVLGSVLNRERIYLIAKQRAVLLPFRVQQKDNVRFGASVAYSKMSSAVGRYFQIY